MRNNSGGAVAPSCRGRVGLSGRPTMRVRRSATGRSGSAVGSAWAGGGSAGQAAAAVDQLADADHACTLRLDPDSLRLRVGVLSQQIKAATTTLGIEPGQLSRHSNEGGRK